MGMFAHSVDVTTVMQALRVLAEVGGILTNVLPPLGGGALACIPV
jgi:hypothetical protein